MDNIVYIISLVVLLPYTGVLGYATSYINSTYIIRDTTHGQIRGLRNVQNDGQLLDTFMGVPFAAPPIGDLRYAAPKLPEPWLTPLDTINYRKGCAQPPGNQLQYDEDCLYLNIFVPYHENVATDPLPVLVWIHGGCWMGGQADVDAGIIAQQDMIVVAVSYRLGSFGFLTTRDSVATGNWGLLDNVMALQWIQNNIANFGGDPTRVTLGGQSSGGVSATLLMFAPSAAGLFHGVLSQSGNAMASWAIHRPPFDPLNITYEFAESLGCPTTTSQIIVDCLRSKPWTEIVDGTATAYDDWCLWTPNIDGVLILEDPTDLLWRGEFSQVPMIIGSTGSEFAYVPTTMTKVDFDAEVREIAQNQYGYAGNVDEATDALIYEFTEPTNAFDEKEIRDEWVQLKTDIHYSSPVDEQCKGHSAQVMNAYKYAFLYFSDGNDNLEHMGATHSSDLPYSWGTPFMGPDRTCPWVCEWDSWSTQPSWSDLDREVSEFFMRSITNLAKYGNPTPTPLNGTIWEPFDVTNDAYLEFNDVIRNTYHYRSRTMLFFQDYYPKVAYRDFAPLQGFATYQSSAITCSPIHVTLFIFALITMYL